MKHHIIIEIPDPKPNTMAAVFATILFAGSVIRNADNNDLTKLFGTAFDAAKEFDRIMRERTPKGRKLS